MKEKLIQAVMALEDAEKKLFELQIAMSENAVTTEENRKAAKMRYYRRNISEIRGYAENILKEMEKEALKKLREAAK